MYVNFLNKFIMECWSRQPICLVSQPGKILHNPSPEGDDLGESLKGWLVQDLSWSNTNQESEALSVALFQASKEQLTSNVHILSMLPLLSNICIKHLCICFCIYLHACMYHVCL